MDRRTLSTVVICFLIFLGWQKFYIEPRLPKTTPAATATQAAPAETTTAAAPGTAPAPTGGLSAQPVKQPAAPVHVNTLTLNTGTGAASVGDAGKFFTDWTLSQFKVDLAPAAANVNLDSVTHTPAGQGELAFDLPELAYANNVQGKFTQKDGVTTWTYEDQNLKLTREYRNLPQQAWVDLKLSAEFKNRHPNFAFVSVASKVGESDHEENDRQLLYYTNDSVTRLHLKDVKPVMDIPGDMKWIGAQSRYFLMSLIPQLGSPRALAQQTGEKAGKISLVYPIAGNTWSVPLKVYFGPKEMNLLHRVEPTLDRTIDFGWFTLFAYPILRFMKWLHGLIGNWGLAIIAMTIAIKALTYPLTLKSMVSMKKMAKLNPQIQALKEKYKDDKETLNREMMTVMRSGGYNPLAGCLPMIVQMPVFFALYRVLYSSIELYHAPFFGWIHDLSVKDPYYITPVLLTLLMWLQQKVTPNAGVDPAQAKMMQFMPLMFGLLMINLPAGLTIYMLVNAAVSIVQTKWINHKIGKTEMAATPATA